jgi:hypothetical protein
LPVFGYARLEPFLNQTEYPAIGHAVLHERRVISWPLFLGLAYGYVGLVVLGLVLSVTTRQQSRRRNIRIATAVLSAPALFVVAFLAFLRFVVVKEPRPLWQIYSTALSPSELTLKPLSTCRTRI